METSKSITVVFLAMWPCNSACSRAVECHHDVKGTGYNKKIIPTKHFFV